MSYMAASESAHQATTVLDTLTRNPFSSRACESRPPKPTRPQFHEHSFYTYASPPIALLPLFPSPLPSTLSNPNPSHYPSSQTRVISDPKTMVHMMDAGKFPAESDEPRRKVVRVKPELVDLAGDGSADEQDSDQQPFSGFSLSKRPKLDPSLQPYDPLAEPSPLGLKLKKSPSFLDLIQMKLCQEKSVSLGKTLPRREKEDHKGAAHMDKLKASNFPATLLRIGTWEYKSRYEGDLVAKCYFAKHKLVWEVLDGGLKNKIEIQWSDIMAINATCPDDGPETLDVVIARQPLFFREINPQPRKHTLWQATADFTGGQATVYRRHFVQCSQGLLGKHFEKLIQCDPRLNFLSQQPAVVLDNPYFESKNSVFGGMDEPRNAFDLKTDSGSDLFDPGNKAASTICASNVDRADSVATPSELNSEGTPSPVTDLCITGELASNRLKEIQRLKLLDQIKVPGFHPSMSMSDLVNHIGQCISEQMTTANPGLSIHDEDQNNILEDIAQYLLSDSQVSPTLDEKSLMSRVDSLCCLLQRDPSVANFQVKPEDSQNLPPPGGKMYDPSMGSGSQIPEPHGESNARNDLQASSAMSRKDSVGELLLDLPRIASLPQFFYNLWEDPGAQS